ncbi:RidA family protein [Actinophytocola oryzae]|uniref:Enamine deaminase RidA (YjgF/YER057c/UK114 family) n=1 Tax=Actinophytocola oryzae TaxID=502181 RepID=A0A4R7VBN9_9PSEU|nr:RidA family protein [Actinophytocola oryzae]TDV46405.1 enamine deaminase RidA (YjgF/YER057c/UK114 family) [Actinophytocola oryzae]
MITQLDPPSLPAGNDTYTHGTLVTGATRTVFVSGQVPWADAEGKVPPTFTEQCRLTWRNVLAVLAEADMGVTDLAKVTCYLADRRYRQEFIDVRTEVLGGHRPALTIIITDIYSADWLLEIEAVAMA